MKVILFISLFLAPISCKPTSTSFKEVVQESLDDVGNILKAKSAVLEYTGN